ncbi:MAG: hypothetical protein CM15mP77_3840 [Synechococcus sp.]|nr:MAG: hypothetical protein CM15mP77_3840 [Synechococcus sp.]
MRQWCSVAAHPDARHLAMDQPHLWVVYPRCRDNEQLASSDRGIWEPSTLSPDQPDLMDSLPEGDDYFSIRGELIFTKPETGELVVKVRQQPRADGAGHCPSRCRSKASCHWSICGISSAWMCAGRVSSFISNPMT